MLDHLEILGSAKLRNQGTATLLDQFRKVHLRLTIPATLLSAAAEDDTASFSSWEDVGGFAITMRRPEVHLSDRLLGTLYQDDLSLKNRSC